MPNTNPSFQENKLSDALRAKGIEVKQQFWDGHKHIDIYISVAKLNIEVDDPGHLINPQQIMSDFDRAYWADKAGYYTLHIPYSAIDGEDFDKIVDAIEKVAILIAQKIH